MFWELELIKANILLLQMSQVLLFWRQNEEHSFAFSTSTTSSSNELDVFLGIISRVKLNDPVNDGEVETTSGDVSAKENSICRLLELLESAQSILQVLA